MANNLAILDDVFAALADPTRRAMVGRLARGDESVSELAALAPMSLPSFLKHVRVLERSGLVRTTKTGRVRTCSLRREQMDALGAWLEDQRRVWEQRTDRLEALVTTLDKENHEPRP